MALRDAPAGAGVGSTGDQVLLRTQAGRKTTARYAHLTEVNRDQAKERRQDCWVDFQSPLGGS